MMPSLLKEPTVATPREQKVRNRIHDEIIRDSVHRMTVLMSPAWIADLWAQELGSCGHDNVVVRALSEALDWRHPEPDRLRAEAQHRMSASD
jgi:hypothetical protein